MWGEELPVSADRLYTCTVCAATGLFRFKSARVCTVYTPATGADRQTRARRCVGPLNHRSMVITTTSHRPAVAPFGRFFSLNLTTNSCSDGRKWRRSRYMLASTGHGAARRPPRSTTLPCGPRAPATHARTHASLCYLRPISTATPGSSIYCRSGSWTRSWLLLRPPSR